MIEAFRASTLSAFAGRIRYTDHVERLGERLFAAVDQLKLEGIVAKRKGSVYSSARSFEWLKIKTAAGKEEMAKRAEAWER